MSDITVNYGLVKPLGTENYDVNIPNANMDIIDGQLKTNSIAIATKASASDLVATNADLTAHLADYVRQPAFGQTTGSTNTYLFSSTPALSALVDGVSAYLDINVANTGASTLNWQGTGEKPMVNADGTALESGDLSLNGIYGVRYNASTGNFQLLGKGGVILTGTALVGDVVNGKTFYNTDPKTIQTGTGASAKRCASGTATTSSTTSLFYTETNSAWGAYFITVTGLTFLPSKIIVWYNNSTNQNITIYDIDFAIINSGSYTCKIVATNGASSTKFVQAIPSVSVTSTGFTLPLALNSTLVNWSAIE